MPFRKRRSSEQSGTIPGIFLLHTKQVSALAKSAMVREYVNRRTYLHALLVFLLLHSSEAAAADAENGRRLYRVCAPCHSMEKGGNKLGPHLYDVVGRGAGTVANFRYSQAMKQAGKDGLVWDENALAEFLSSPGGKVPGTSMRFWGLWFRSDIEDLISYMKSHR
jgi:cytochrome c